MRAVAAAAGAAFLMISLAGARELDYETAIARLRDAAVRSPVMDIATVLTDQYGPRLTGSPAIGQAGDYVAGRLRAWGVANVHLENFPFGRGWSNERFAMRIVTPQPYPLLGFPRAWTPGTNGPLQGPAVLAAVTTDAELAGLEGKLRGAYLLTEPVVTGSPAEGQLLHRFTDAELAALTKPAPQRQPRTTADERAFRARRDAFFLQQGVGALLEPSRGADPGGVLVARSGARRPDDPPVSTQIILASEHYARIARLLRRGVSVTLEADIRNAESPSVEGFNIIGELPGTDRADEVVMLGGHFDSWHAGTGAADNAAGCVAMIEALRLLKAAGLPLRRTVRLALWGGEEQGLLGSRAHVKRHFADTARSSVLPAHAKLSAYFNLDAGAGAIRGIYLQGNDAAGPVLSPWLAPFANARTVSPRNSGPGGSDNSAFDEVGLPGFGFIQDPLDYEARAHHTNLDVYERLNQRDLIESAIIAAAVVYSAANAPALVPRKPLPAALKTPK